MHGDRQSTPALVVRQHEDDVRTLLVGRAQTAREQANEDWGDQFRPNGNTTEHSTSFSVRVEHGLQQRTLQRAFHGLASARR